MPTSVRTLWTATLVLSMGCQGLPSQSTNPSGNARVQWSQTRWLKNPSSSHTKRMARGAEISSSVKKVARLDEVDKALWRVEGFDSNTDDVDRPAETRPASPRGVDYPAHPLPLDEQIEEGTETVLAQPRVESDEIPPHESSALAPPPQRRVDPATRRGEIELAANHPTVDAQPPPRNFADAVGAFTDREGSLVDDIRSRFSRRGRKPQSTPRPALAPDGPFYERPSAPVDGGESSSSPVISMSVEADSRGTREGPGAAGVPLEAPEPLSSVTRQTVLVERLGELPYQDAEVAQNLAEDVRAENKSEEGFVSSLFDRFGIGADRTKNREANAEILLRKSRLAELQRPLADVDLHDPPPSEEALLTPLQTLQWQEDLDRLTNLLETQLASQMPGESPLEQDYYVRQQVALRLLYLIGSRRAEALQAIPHCDRSQQEFWTALLWALSNIFDEEAMPDRSHRARESATQLRVALEHITPLAGLKLAKCQFCRQIDGFGSYETFERDEFSPGQSVLIYAEIQNFLSDVTPEGEYLTVLQSTITIREQSPSHRVVFHDRLSPTEDRCRSRRSDYYHNYRVQLPHTLKPGPHVLLLNVRDQLSQKEDVVSLNFFVGPVQAK